MKKEEKRTEVKTPGDDLSIEVHFKELHVLHAAEVEPLEMVVDTLVAHVMPVVIVIVFVLLGIFLPMYSSIQ